jgi:hypothetical protein
MNLITLLAELDVSTLQRLAGERIPGYADRSREALCSLLDEALRRDARFIRTFVMDRQPPTFAVLVTLLEAPKYTVARLGFEDNVMQRTAALCDMISSGELLPRHDELRVYRRVLYEARHSDQRVETSEWLLLNALRREFGISLVEHFLIEHHPDLQEFWRSNDSFGHELRALQSAGLVFARPEEVVLPEELANDVRRAIGVDMPGMALRRLYAEMPSSALVEVLASLETKVSGSKEERIDRLIAHWASPRAVLEHVSADSLRDICREAGAAVSGAKEDLIDRIVAHFCAGLDGTNPEPDATPTPVAEQRTLDESRFKLLFMSLKGRELRHILEAFRDLRQSGPKPNHVETLWRAHRSEHTLLSTLKNRELEDLLYRLHLKMGGSKIERIERLISHFATGDPLTLAQPEASDD